MGSEGNGGERYFPEPEEMKAMEDAVRTAMEQGVRHIHRPNLRTRRNAAPAEVELSASGRFLREYIAHMSAAGRHAH